MVFVLTGAKGDPRGSKIMIWDSGNFLLVIFAIFLTASEVLLRRASEGH